MIISAQETTVYSAYLYILIYIYCIYSGSSEVGKKPAELHTAELLKQLSDSHTNQHAKNASEKALFKC